MAITFSKITNVITNTSFHQVNDVLVDYLLTDSRKLLIPSSTIFFALEGNNRQGISFVTTLYHKGVRCFVVPQNINSHFFDDLPQANFVIVNNVLHALQQLVTHHRNQFNIPVIGITGSNGKTIVKEWLYQLLHYQYKIVRSPKSYNSQIGVPLSVWKMNAADELAIFESGISQPNEMALLQPIINPSIGIVTSMGSAHNEGFTSMQQKINEKLLLFTQAKFLVYNIDDVLLHDEVNKFKEEKNKDLKTITWGVNENATIKLINTEKKNDVTSIELTYYNNNVNFIIPFTDNASVANAISCFCVLVILKVDAASVAPLMEQLRPIEMRLQLKKGLHNCSIINDSYSADIESFAISLDFLAQQNQQAKHTVILSDLLQTGVEASLLYQQIASILQNKHLYRFIGIGTQISENASFFKQIDHIHFYATTNDFISNYQELQLQNEVILLKGARKFQFERISSLLEEKVHETQLEINLNSIRHNLNVYRKLQAPGVKTMVMVKAFSYGTGGFEIANVLQHAGVDYLAVAYADEAIELRNASIQLPIMIMNTEVAGFSKIVQYHLEPEIYSINILQKFIAFLNEKQIKHYPIFIKLDTGMHRLGFDESDIPTLCNILKKTNSVKVVSAFSHLVASDAAQHDDFTAHQATLFLKMAALLEQALGYTFIKHIANSSAIYRHPTLQYDMVRLGIGLYGVDATPFIQQQLAPVATLKTTISQIKWVKPGESVGYNRNAMVQQNTKVATVRIGYADGYPRLLGNGNGKMLVNDMLAPVIGNICMDMTMLDITGIDANEGDEIIVFGEQPTVNNMATWATTIPYEILTNISQRVKRVYFED
ncbi:bifunctional UDP-N-acetylmuramoyl-tripeptide:D-alanyl-D-alanine ligase/alanine racemase [Ferruginibacter yonginensis]|uniref:Alanine racemase n=1 Tax=Ferruginibacter yonginensis TaxID=1310416 RepID=A0ABV8QQC7_9BACT